MQWLENALDYGIDEDAFWDMSLAELNRKADSMKRRQQKEAKEKASSDYTLANLIGKSIARLYSSSATYPAIEEVYPKLFNTKEVQEEKQQKKDELSVIRFTQFAKMHNQKFTEKEGETE